jgi:hypothetical protein
LAGRYENKNAKTKMNPKYPQAQIKNARYVQGDSRLDRIAKGTLVNRLTTTWSSGVTSGLGLYLLMVNVPFLLGVWDWTVQSFYRR